MATPEEERKVREGVDAAVRAFASGDLRKRALGLLEALGYRSDKTADFGTTPDAFVQAVEDATGHAVDPERGLVARWKQCAFLFQLTNDEIPMLAYGQQSMFGASAIVPSLIQSFVFIAIELDHDSPKRTDLANITRELNRRFTMPAVLIFKHAGAISLAVIDRRANKRDREKDVLERVTIVKDVNIEHPHAAQVRILAGLAIGLLGDKHRPSNFDALYKAWKDALSIQTLNRRFYTELFHWYVWAVQQVEFPKGGGEDKEKRDSVAVIRLLTRLIFVWFIKEKRLVPEEFFDAGKLGGLLNTDPLRNGADSNYYLAVLQNLFFATLSVEMLDEQGNSRRAWAIESDDTKKEDYQAHSLLRHKSQFVAADRALALFDTIPFLNGGLFECLDRVLTNEDFKRTPALRNLAILEVSGEHKSWALRVDGFSRLPDSQPKVPNRVFFGGQAHVDLYNDLGNSGRDVKVLGLIDILQNFKFTIEENTPVEEEVALDPELLGKVFENLLASYNADTRTTARKLTGSFYTPREVVDYMVDEALVAHWTHALGGVNTTTPADLESRLRDLVAYSSAHHRLKVPETNKLVEVIEEMRILDPACGSGAFPMGALNKLVYVLNKLDRDNVEWRAQNRERFVQRLTAAENSRDLTRRDKDVVEARSDLERFDREFDRKAHADYTRKLYLIERCIHGVDKEPIAVQIAKLRFFISLIVSQPVEPALPNLGLTPLPNLETKIVAADSLTPLAAQHSLVDLELLDCQKQMRALRPSYFSARTLARKRELRAAMTSVREREATLLERESHLTEETRSALLGWDQFDQNNHAAFFDPEWMFGLAQGFDVVIGNPPYVRQEQIKDLKHMLKQHYDCFTGTADLFVYFYERSIKMLRPHGSFAFITSNKWYRAKYGEKLRAWMKANAKLLRIIDFGDAPVFDAIAYPTILITSRRERALKSVPKDETVLALNWSDANDVATFPAVFAREAFAVPVSGLADSGWQIENQGKRDLLNQIAGSRPTVAHAFATRLYRGITTGLNDAFVVDSTTRQRLIDADSSSADIFVPYLRGRDVRRWRAADGEMYLIRIESSENVRHAWTGLELTAAEMVFKRTYPSVHAWLTGFRKALIDRTDQGHYFWELRSCVYWDVFGQEKVLSTKISLQPTFALDISGALVANTAYFIPVMPADRYVVALLNSTVSAYYSRQTFLGKQNGYYEVQPAGLESFPVPTPSQQAKASLNVLVESQVVRGDPRIEQLLNALVYELYFPDDLHAANLHFFEAIEQAGIGVLAKLRDTALADAADEFVERVFANNHPVYAMLFDLQALDVVRIIEGKE